MLLFCVEYGHTYPEGGSPVTAGSKTLRQMCFLEWSGVFFLRLTFWAIDSVHLAYENV